MTKPARGQIDSTTRNRLNQDNGITRAVIARVNSKFKLLTNNIL